MSNLTVSRPERKAETEDVVVAVADAPVEVIPEPALLIGDERVTDVSGRTR